MVPGEGLPLNLENCLRRPEAAVGSSISGKFETWRFLDTVRTYIDQIEDYYEGRRSMPSSSGFGGIYHNLAVWGFTVRESLDLTPAACTRVIEKGEGWIDDDVLGIPAAPMHRTARMVLNPRGRPDREDRSQVGMLELLCKTEPPDVVMIWLGANDCLGTVLSLEIREMPENGVPRDPIERMHQRWNLTSASTFRADFEELGRRVHGCLPDTCKVFVATVPHVTIPPLTRGVGKMVDSYYERYGRFFQSEQSIGPMSKTLSRAEARHIDARIDAFNASIESVADTHGWHVVPTCKVLDELAVRRNGFDDPALALREYYANRPDHPLLSLDPVPSILMLATKDGRRVQGGLMSLDGVHPSTLGYGIVAELFLDTMKRAGVAGADPAKVPWHAVIANDTLLDPPALWDDVVGYAERYAELWDLIFRMLD